MSPTVRQLARGTSAHFEDAAYYTSAYRERTLDIDYYLTLALERDATVLEYGCGNGRIALPLAHAGVRVTGVDRSLPMLADLRARLQRTRPQVRERVTVRRGDMRALSIGRRFDLVLCTFNTFLHLYTRRDVERFLTRVKEHLARGGRFVVDLSIPVAEELARDPARLYRWPRFRHAGTGELVRYGERFDYDPLSQVLMIGMEFVTDAPERTTPGANERQRLPPAKAGAKSPRSWSTPLAHRQFYPQELEALFHYNGFEVVTVHADYRRQAPTRDSDEIIYHCRARGR